jgi:glycosyltransferase involved in cell wall biosynthesis
MKFYNVQKLAIITTHPIQYYAPVFKLLYKRKNIDIKVFYTWGNYTESKHDPGFGGTIEWDLPLLEDYPYEWVENTAAQPGSHHFKGIVNPGIIEQISNWQPGAILVFGWAYHSHLKILRYFKNKLPVYFRGDSTLLDETPGFRSLLKTIFLKWVYRHIDHAFYAGTNNRAYFKRYGLRDDQLSFAPHAVDNNRFSADQINEVNGFKQSLGIAEGDIVILFAGKLEAKKSPGLLLNSFLALNIPHTHLVFAGSGKLEEELKHQASAYSNIHFIGFQNQSVMPAAYQLCDIFCLPSQGPGETWGLAVNEAMACGKAILVSDKCGCAIDLVNKNNGIIFKSGVSGELKQALKQLTLSKSSLSQLGENSRLLIKDWNFLKIVEHIESKITGKMSAAKG